MPENAASLHLAHPPVRSVALAIMFDATPQLQGWHLSEFFTSLEDNVLSKEEVAPIPADLHGQIEVLAGAPGWPIPRTRLVSKDYSLAIQQDALEITWSFNGDTDDASYIGFDSLKDKLEETIGSLIQSVATNHVSITPRDTQCTYVNHLSGITGVEASVGVLTKWSTSDPRITSDAQYIGARIRTNPLPGGQPALIMVDSQPNEPPKLTIRTQRHIGPNDSAISALCDAHDEVIRLFMEYTSSEQREKWGES